MSIMANYWAAQGRPIALITLASKQKDFYELDPRVDRIALDVMGSSSTAFVAVKNNTMRLRRLRSAILDTAPDVVISFMDRGNVRTLIATWGLPFPIVVSDRIVQLPSLASHLWERIRKVVYRRARAVVVLTNEMKHYAIQYSSPSRIHVIPNPVHSFNFALDKKPVFRLPTPLLVAAGRLVHQKGFDLLLEAFSRCKHKDWSIAIAGEGPERQRLQCIAEQLGIKSRVHFIGVIDNLEEMFKSADLFVLSSRFEGFPNVLVEAMSCGLPVVSFECPTGPKDIIRPGIDGLLIPQEDVGALTEAMDRLMGDENERKMLGQRATDVSKRFSLEEIMGRWEKLIEVGH